MARPACNSTTALAACGMICISLISGTGAIASTSNPAGDARANIQPLLTKYCFDCHGGGTQKGDVNLDNFSSDQFLLHNPEFWWKVLKNVRAGIMPPHDEPQPTDDEKARLAQWIKSGAFGIDPSAPDAGRVTVRRLNRVEYGNTIRDLVGVDFHSTEEFPPDDTGYGFDTIGDALSVSPMLLEKYMQAAQTIVGMAVPLSTREPTTRLAGQAFRDPGGESRAQLPFHVPSVASATFNAAHTGNYHVTIRVKVNGGFDSTPDRCKVTLKIGDDVHWTNEFGWADDETQTFSFDAPLDAGRREFTFSAQPLTPEAEQKKTSNLEILGVQIDGPAEQQFWTPTANYSRFFPRPLPPTDPAERRAYARQVIGDFAGKAFRRPADDRTLDRLVSLAELVYSAPGKTFEQGIGNAMVAILASPRFLFRTEQSEAGPPGSICSPIDEYSLASRLSYFFWSSTPDDVLLNLAGKHQLRSNLAVQMQRLLIDRRSDAMVRNFAGQWLELRDLSSIPINARVVLQRDAVPLGSTTQPSVDPQRTGRGRFTPPRIQLDPPLRQALNEEPIRLFSHIIRRDLTLLDLLDANYTFLNEPLAKLYDIQGVQGNDMRQVSLPADSPRGGVLSMGAFLVVTSNPTRTSPVKRGQFILNNILGMPAPPPPANIPALEESDHSSNGPAMSFRQVLAIHRSRALCASCHARMDPLGLSMENFNALGIWRQTERGQAIDASGKLLSGESFHDERDLKKIIATNHRTDFYRCLTEKMLTYALGRGLEYYDVDAVDRIVDRVQSEDGRASALIDGIVESVPFQQRRNFVPSPQEHLAPPATQPANGVGS